MNVELQTIQAAFEKHRQRYDQDGRGWSNPDHVKMWDLASRAFDGPSFQDFDKLYAKLRGKWQVFRGGIPSWDAQQVFDALHGCDPAFRQKRLSSVSEDDTIALWRLLQAVQGLKKNKSGPSVVAISKFLHFWNPRLFVIVDSGVMWNWVLSHAWLWQEVEDVRRRTDRRIFGKIKRHATKACDLSTYVAILNWAAEVIRLNPSVLTEFNLYVRRTAGETAIPPDLAHYEAVAVEWFLLGLVELPPAGVSNVNSPTVTA